MLGGRIFGMEAKPRCCSQQSVAPEHRPPFRLLLRDGWRLEQAGYSEVSVVAGQVSSLVKGNVPISPFTREKALALPEVNPWGALVTGATTGSAATEPGPTSGGAQPAMRAARWTTREHAAVAARQHEADERMAEQHTSMEENSRIIEANEQIRSIQAQEV